MNCARVCSLLLLCVILQACQPSAVGVFPPPPPAAMQDKIGSVAQTSQLDPDDLWHEAQPVLEARCVVCHGCYDAPCQLVMSAPDGVQRGGTKIQVYEASRLLAIDPTRLFIDAGSEAAWRKKGFHPVLASPDKDPAAGLILRMLDLKRQHPLAMNSQPLPEGFTLGLDREQTCAASDEFADYAEAHPSWGMPYALPGLSEAEEIALRRWIMAGAPRPTPPASNAPLDRSIAAWETMLNGETLKERVVARYIYEHLFLAHLYFPDVDSKIFFRLVRSRTKDGAAIEEIPTRRPFDDPGDTFYYRLRRMNETLVSKTHMPYPLSAAKLARVKQLFLEPDYEVRRMPSYESDSASNPFLTFRELPARARYRFMLDEAGFTIMGFIKGPVCRGQVALDVIRDRFWMVFVDPESPLVAAEAAFLADAAPDLTLPASDDATASITTWLKYARAEKKWLETKSRHLSKQVKSPSDVTLASIWNGQGTNENAALTVFRHFDSASVVQGLVGEHPLTTWVVDYPLLERIHYLLVAGFDVFGNVGHQLNTRMYMDFLRMEGEHNFLRLLPVARRKQLVDRWYQNVDKDVKAQVYGRLARFDEETGLTFKTDKPEHELYEKLRAHLEKVRSKRYELAGEAAPIQDSLAKLSSLHGKVAASFSEISFLELRGPSAATYVTFLRDAAHRNVATLFDEEDRRTPDQDRLSVVRGFLGAYPNTLFSVDHQGLAEFVSLAGAAQDKDGYAALCQRFCIRRSSPDFWKVSDRMTQAFHQQSAVEFGIFDLNRLEDR